MQRLPLGKYLGFKCVASHGSVLRDFVLSLTHSSPTDHCQYIHVGLLSHAAGRLQQLRDSWCAESAGRGGRGLLGPFIPAYHDDGECVKITS